jgi:hypothetical protein
MGPASAIVAQDSAAARSAHRALGLDVRTEGHGALVGLQAHRIRHQTDGLKSERIASLEAILDEPDGPGTVFGCLPLWEDGINRVVSETFDDDIRSACISLLVRAYRHHFDDDTGEAAIRVKNAAACALMDVMGPSFLREATRFDASKELARAIFSRASWLGHPATRVPKPMVELLDRFGVDGSGTRVLVIDRAEVDPGLPGHMSHTSYLAHPAPAGSGSEMLTYGLTSVSGPELVRGVVGAIRRATRENVDVVSMSLGVSFEGADRRAYESAYGERAASVYAKHMAVLGRAIDAFPGLVVVAAGQDAPPNDFGGHGEVLVVGGLDAESARFLPWSAPPPPRSLHVGVSTKVLARDRHGGYQELEGQTSWAAPQAAYYAAGICELARTSGVQLPRSDLLGLIARTARPVEGGLALDPIAAAVALRP